MEKPHRKYLTGNQLRDNGTERAEWREARSNASVWTVA